MKILSWFEHHSALHKSFAIEAKSLRTLCPLPARSRTRLADKLLETLDQPRQREFDTLWANEVEDRIDAYEGGEIKVISRNEVFRKLRIKKNR